MIARRLHPLGVLLVMAAIMLGVGLCFAGRAVSQPNVDTNVAIFAAQHADDVCATLRTYPSADGVAGIVMALTTDSGFTGYEAGQIIALAVESRCPQYAPLLDAFSNTYAPHRLKAT